MSLVNESLPPSPGRLPAELRRFLREARRRARRFQHSHHVPAFDTSDFEAVGAALGGLEASGRLTGRWFCEWGSGLGVVGCLAALLGFDAWGIEAERDLVVAARRLAADFDVPAEFVCGSFLPEAPAARAGLDLGHAFGWLNTAAPGGHEALGLAPEEFDLIFAFPWPDEEGLIAALFDHQARIGAALLTYHGDEGLRLRRKV